MIALKCPACNAPLQVPDRQSRSLCTFCGTPIALRDLAPAAAMPPAGDTNGSAAVPIPDKLQVAEFGDELTITWKWFSWIALFLIPFAIAWNAFLIGWYGMAGAMPDQMPGPMKLIFLVFPLGHVAVGLGLIYLILTLLFNRTTVQVRHGELSVEHGPLYFPGSCRVDVDEITTLTCRVEPRQGDGRPKPTLTAQLKSGRSVSLLPYNSEADVAGAVQMLVERHLGLNATAGGRG